MQLETAQETIYQSSIMKQIFAPCSIVSIIKFEHIIAGWDSNATLTKKLFSSNADNMYSNKITKLNKTKK